jgi:Rod binding domain-containing protein
MMVQEVNITIGASTLQAPSSAAASRAKALEVAGQFEEIFARQMVEQLRDTSLTGEEGGLFGDSAGASTYASWFDDHMAHHLSSKGRIGIADNLMGYFEKSHQIPTDPKIEGEIDEKH